MAHDHYKPLTPTIPKHVHLAEVDRWRALARAMEKRIIEQADELAEAKNTLKHIKQLTTP